MQTGQILNLSHSPSEKRREEPPLREEPSMNDEASLRDMFEQARSDMRAARLQFELQQEEQQAHRRRTKVLSVILVLLIVCLIGAAWFVYPTVKGQENVVAEMLGLQDLAKSMGQHVQSLEIQLDKSTAALPAMADRMDKLQASMKSSLQSVRSQASAAANDIGKRLKQDLDRSLQAVQSRMAGIESNQHESAARVMQLQDEITGLKRELAGMREQNVNSAEKAAESVQQLREQQEVSGKELSGLGQRLGSSQAALDALANRVDRQRVDFNLPNSQPRQIAPGITLLVSRVDVKKQQFDGLLMFGADAKNLILRRHDTQDPIAFHAAGDNRPVELVVTQVSKNGASGYLVMPAPLAIAEKAGQ